MSISKELEKKIFDAIKETQALVDEQVQDRASFEFLAALNEPNPKTRLDKLKKIKDKFIYNNEE